MNELFPIEDVALPEPPARPNDEPYFIVAYWPRGRYWAPKGGFFKTSAATEKTVETLRQAGWTNIHIMRLPPLP